MVGIRHLARNYQSLLPHYRETLRLGLPLVVGQLGQIVIGFADSAMIGHHSVSELAAASFCLNLFYLPVVVVQGYSLGLVPLMGQRLGRGDRLGAGSIFRTGLWSNLRLSLAVTLLMGLLYFGLDHLGQPERLLPLIRPYFLLQLLSLPFVTLFSTFKQVTDTVGRTAVSMWITLGGNVLNVVGNALLIYGLLGFPEWGLLGAGVATLGSRVIMVLAQILVLVRGRYLRRERLGFFRRKGPFRPAWQEVLHTSSFISLQMGLECGMFSLSIYMVGWLGETALAAHQVAVTIQSLGFMSYGGIAAAASIRISQFWGRGDIIGAKRAANAGFHTVLLIAAGIIALMITLRGPMTALFTSSPGVIALAELLLVAVIVYQPFDALQVSYSNALRGIGETTSLALIALVGYFAVGLPLGYILAFPLGLGTVGVWSAFPVGLGIAGLGYFLRFRRRINTTHRRTSA